LLSNCTTAAPDVSATPLFVAGAITHPCTSAVTSTATYAPAWLTETVCAAVPNKGSVANVTVDSPHAPFTGCKLTDPAVSTRLQYSRSVAREICAAVVPVGSVERSNCSSAVYPPPTFKLEIPPLFTPGRALFTWASATSVASTANAGKAAADNAANPNPARNLR
jgi:hypothetical protein